MRVLVTGGCGFIGSAVVRHLIQETEHEVINVDLMTYAATEGSVMSVANDERYRHLAIDIRDPEAVDAAFLDHQPEAVMHLAAESHVDRSIDGPEEFMFTNIVGTMHLLQAARSLMLNRPAGGAGFHGVAMHVSYYSCGGGREGTRHNLGPGAARRLNYVQDRGRQLGRGRPPAGEHNVPSLRG